MADSEQTTAAEATQQTVGQVLQKARAAQEQSLDQLAAELRIEPKQLIALEQNQFERIGVPVFVKGYLKQYGGRLGLDYRDLLALYSKHSNLKEVEVKPSRTIKLRDDQQITGWVIGGLVLAVIGVVFAVWWFSDTGFGPAATPAIAPAVAPATPTPSDGAGAAAAPTETPALPVTPEATPATPAPGAVAPPPQSTPTAAAAARTTLASALGANAPVSAPLTPPPAAPSGAGAAPAELGAYAADLDLTFDEESWTEITDARGERLLFGLSSAGRHAKLRGQPPFSVTLGNANAVRLLVDGEAYAIPEEAREGKLAKFTVDVTAD